MISDKIVGLRIASRKAAMCENADSVKNTLSLKTKILFLIRNKGLAPSDIIDSLMIVKTNLAILTTAMVKQGLIQKTKNPADKREITYTITDAGIQYLEKRLETIEDLAKKAFPDDGEYSEAEIALENALNLFEFLL